VKCSTLVAAIKNLSLNKELRPQMVGEEVGQQQTIWIRTVDTV
jgi:hypothetical protein